MRILTLLLLLVASATARAQCPDKPDVEVIDTHTHGFNLRYLPVRGIAYSWRLPSIIADPLCRLLIGLTGDFRKPGRRPATRTDPRTLVERGSADQMRAELARAIRESDLYDNLQRVENDIDDYLVQEIEAETAGAVRGARTARAAPILTDWFIDHHERAGTGLPINRSALRGGAVRSLLDGVPVEIKVLGVTRKIFGLAGDIAGYLRTLLILLMPEDKIFETLQQDVFCEVDIFISAMMDMRHTYRDKPIIRFSRQIDRMEELAGRHPGKLYFLGAYDPFRRGDGLGLVEKARAQGAIGFKFYPPAGYRADATEIPPRPDNRHMARQWDHRYRWLGGDPARLDAQNERYFQYAADNELLIYSHHTALGFESAGGYGATFGAPGAWAPVLRRHPTLRLVIAHAGGATGWFNPDQWAGSRAEQAYNLCVLWENVYCELGDHIEVNDRDARARFVTHLAALASIDNRAGPGAAERFRARRLTDATVGTAAWQYRIVSKLMYGSDWMMVARKDDHRRMVRSFDRAFRQPALAPHRAAFFAGNARKAFRLPPRQDAVP